MTRWIFNPRSFLAMAFLVGAAFGAWSMRYYFDRTLGKWDPTEKFAAKLTEDLNLSVDQRRRVAVLLTDQKRTMEDMRDRWRSDVRVLARQGEDQIAGLLTPDQMDLFMRLHDQIHGRMDQYLWSSETGPSAVVVPPSGN